MKDRRTAASLTTFCDIQDTSMNWIKWSAVLLGVLAADIARELNAR